MMFDVVKLRAQVSFRDVESAREFVLEIVHLRGVSESFFGMLEDAQARGGVENLFVQVR